MKWISRKKIYDWNKSIIRRVCKSVKIYSKHLINSRNSLFIHRRYSVLMSWSRDCILLLLSYCKNLNLCMVPDFFHKRYWSAFGNRYCSNDGWFWILKNVPYHRYKCLTEEFHFPYLIDDKHLRLGICLDG